MNFSRQKTNLHKLLLIMAFIDLENIEFRK